MSKTSKGEQKLINIFCAAGLYFQQEVSFKNLVGAHGVPLRFDFALLRDKKILALIEFDGIQHFQFTPHFHKTKSDFRQQQEWDRKKNKFCLLNKIPLIRIPYWDLEELTLNKILTNPAYRVVNKDHNLLLKQQGVRK